MFDLFGQKFSADPTVAAWIKEWVREVFGLPDEAIVMVTELRCKEEGCPDVETVIAIMGGPGYSCKHKLFKPMAEVTHDDLKKLAADHRSS